MCFFAPLIAKTQFFGQPYGGRKIGNEAQITEGEKLFHDVDPGTLNIILVLPLARLARLSAKIRSCNQSKCLFPWQYQLLSAWIVRLSFDRHFFKSFRIHLRRLWGAVSDAHI